jgi:general secretion pathway protein K
MVTALLALFAGSMAAAMRTESRIAQAQRAAAEGRAIADAAIHLAIARLLATDVTQRPRLDGSPTSLLVEDQPVLLWAEDETGKLDLNTATPAVLRRYLEVMLDDPLVAEALAAAVLARRRPGPGRRPFLDLAELLLLPGVTPAVLAHLAPGLTVYSQQPGPDPATAVPASLLALPGMTSAEVERILALRAAAEATASDTQREIFGSAVEIRVELERGGLRVRRRAVLRIVADRAQPVWVYAWE